MALLLRSAVPTLRQVRQTSHDRHDRQRRARVLEIYMPKVEAVAPSVAAAAFPAAQEHEESFFASLQHHDRYGQTEFSPVIRCSPGPPHGINATVLLKVELPSSSALGGGVGGASDLRSSKLSLVLYWVAPRSRVSSGKVYVKHPLAGVGGVPIATVALSVEALVEAWTTCGANTCLDSVTLEATAHAPSTFPSYTAQLFWSLTDRRGELESLASIVLSDITMSPTSPRDDHHHVAFAAPDVVPASTEGDDVVTTQPRQMMKTLDLTQVASAASSTEEEHPGLKESASIPSVVAEAPVELHHVRSASAVSSVESLIPSSPERDETASRPPATSAAPRTTVPAASKRRLPLVRREDTTKPPLAVKPTVSTPRNTAAGINTSLTKPSSRPTTPRAGMTTARSQMLPPARSPRQATPVGIPPKPNAPVSLATKSWWTTVPLGIDVTRASEGWVAIRRDAAEREVAAKALLDEELLVSMPVHDHLTHPRLIPLIPDVAPWCPAGAHEATCQRKFSEIKRVLQAEDEYLCHGTAADYNQHPPQHDRHDQQYDAAALRRTPSTCRARSSSCGRAESQPPERETALAGRRTSSSRSSSAERATPNSSAVRIPWYGNSPHANFLSSLFRAAAASAAASRVDDDHLLPPS